MFPVYQNKIDKNKNQENNSQCYQTAKFIFPVFTYFHSSYLTKTEKQFTDNKHKI